MNRKLMSVLVLTLAGILLIGTARLLPGGAKQIDPKNSSKQDGLIGEVAGLKRQLIEVNRQLDDLNKATQELRKQLPPIGTIVAWHRDIAGKDKVQLPPGWVECDGKSITTGPLQGQRTPALNTPRTGYGGGHFLRGGQQSGTFQEATALFGKWEGAGGAAVPGDDNQFAANADGTLYHRAYWDNAIIKGTSEPKNEPFYYVRPVNMSVIWIMRIN